MYIIFEYQNVTNEYYTKILFSCSESEKGKFFGINKLAKKKIFVNFDFDQLRRGTVHHTVLLIPHSVKGTPYGFADTSFSERYTIRLC